MTATPSPTGPDRRDGGQDVAGATAIFAQWQVYKSIIDRDFMRHREIYAGIHAFVESLYPRRFSLLDLGCGDATSIARTFAGTALSRYTGVDASASALQAARRDVVLPQNAAAIHLAPACGGQGGIDVFGAGFGFVHLLDFFLAAMAFGMVGGAR